METTVQKWGNSLALRIPAAVAEQISVREGDRVELRVNANSLVVRPSRCPYDLDSLVKGIKPNNIHRETGWGAAHGKELW